MHQDKFHKGMFAFTVDRPVATIMSVLAIVVFGWVSLAQLPVNLMPEINYPTITIRTTYDGAAPEEIEDQITEPIEDLVGTVEGVVEVTSTSRAGSSDVVLRFQWDTELDFATQKVRERIAMIRFPENNIRPSVLRYDPTLDPILRIAITGAPLNQLRHFATDELKPIIERLDGVAMLRVLGGEEEIIEVALSEERMLAYQIDVNLVRDRLSAENINLAGGRLSDGELEYLVRTRNQLENLREIQDLVLTTRGNEPVRLRDIATVTRSVHQRTVITRNAHRLHEDPTQWIEGESVELAIYKEADANLVNVASSIRNMLAIDENSGSFELPEEMSLQILSDQSVFIEGAIKEVSRSAMFGGILAIFVLLFFLQRGYSMVVIALAIPLSIIAIFAPLRALNISLNIMSLGGIALGVGMLVDNAIVVLESIVRCSEEGDSPRDAAIRGTKEVGGAVIASTFTTVAVFFPIVFVDGIAGQLFGDLATSVVLSLIASLLFAIFFVPMLALLPWRVTTRLSEKKSSKIDPVSDFLLNYTQTTQKFTVCSEEINTCKTHQIFNEKNCEKSSNTSLLSLQNSCDNKKITPLWKKALRFKSFVAMIGDFSATFRRWLRINVFIRIFLIPIVLIVFAYILMRTLLHFPIELILKLVTLIAFPIAFLGMFAFKIASFIYRYTVGFALTSFAWFLLKITKIYAKTLGILLKQRTIILLIVSGLIGWTVWIYPTFGVQLIPELHQGSLAINAQWPVGTTLEETSIACANFEERLYEHEEIETISSFIGVDKDALDLAERGEHTATISLQLTQVPNQELQERETIQYVQDLIDEFPGLHATITRPTFFSMADPIAIEVHGQDLQGMTRTADEVVRVVAELDQIQHVRSNLRAGFPEIRITFDRQRLTLMGLDARSVAEGIQRRIQGSTPTTYHGAEQILDLVVRNQQSDVASIENLENLVVGYVSSASQTASFEDVSSTSFGNETTQIPVRLRSIATISLGRGPSEIRHVEGQRSAIISAETNEIDLGSVNEALIEVLREVEREPQQEIVITGQREELEASQRSLSYAFLLAVFLVYIVMASTFESILAPLVILLTIPLSLIGVAAALWITKSSVSVIVLIGVIVLTGIVVNNAIVMVDYIIHRRRAGELRHEAIVNAASIRLRPVLITATTTILGLIPMAISVGQGSELRRPLAWVVMSGLAVSTLLTLFVIPIVYDLIGELFGPPKKS